MRKASALSGALPTVKPFLTQLGSASRFAALRVRRPLVMGNAAAREWLLLATSGSPWRAPLHPDRPTIVFGWRRLVPQLVMASYGAVRCAAAVELSQEGPHADSSYLVRADVGIVAG